MLIFLGIVALGVVVYLVASLFLDTGFGVMSTIVYVFIVIGIFASIQDAKEKSIKHKYAIKECNDKYFDDSFKLDMCLKMEGISVSSVEAKEAANSAQMMSMMSVAMSGSRR